MQDFLSPTFSSLVGLRDKSVLFSKSSFNQKKEWRTSFYCLYSCDAVPPPKALKISHVYTLSTQTLITDRQVMRNQPGPEMSPLQWASQSLGSASARDPLSLTNTSCHPEDPSPQNTWFSLPSRINKTLENIHTEELVLVKGGTKVHSMK